MKFKKIFFILFLMLLIINCEIVSAKLSCQYKGANRNIEMILDGDKVSVYSDNKLVKGNVNFECSEKTGCPQKIYISSGENNIYVYNSRPADPYPGAPNNHIALNLSKTKRVGRKVSCGSGQGIITGIPKKIPELTSFAFTLVQVAVPVILVIMGSIDLFKGITAQKEDEIKKGRQMFIKRLAIAAIIYFVVIIVKFLISIVADTNVSNMVDCIDCFVSNNCN